MGRALSRRLGWVFEDLDERIQALEGRTIVQIFQRSGEAGFRRAEHAALEQLVREPASARVVALGGGTFAQPENAELIGSVGASVVFLDAPAEELFERCRQDPVERPLQRDLEQFRQLYEARLPSYLMAALRVETGGKNVEAVAAEVACALGFQ